jgi:GMP synthase-like glutamine amidotransferase
MNIGILQCGHVRDELVAQHGRYPEMFSSLLTQADPTLTFTLYDAKHDHLPSHVNACDAYLITGSRHSVNEGLPWISKLEDFILDLHAAQKKIIGICFGHQLIAKTLGGKVIKSPGGWGVGMSKNKITQQKSWMNPPLDKFNLLMSHQEQVVELPPGAEVLASNEACPFYMIQIGNNLTVQGHPEFSKDYSRALIEYRKDILDMARYEQGLQSLQLEKDDALVARWIVNFLLVED